MSVDPRMVICRWAEDLANRFAGLRVVVDHTNTWSPFCRVSAHYQCLFLTCDNYIEIWHRMDIREDELVFRGEYADPGVLDAVEKLWMECLHQL